MVQRFTRLLGRYGTDLLLRNGTTTKRVRGILFSVNSRSWQNMERAFVSLGEIPRGQYICILPAKTEVEPGCFVTVDGRVYEFRRVEPVRFGKNRVYLWCLCVEKGGEDVW